MTQSNHSGAKKPLLIPLAASALFVFQTLAAKAGTLVSKQLDFTTLDPDGLFLPISVHHIIQALIALAAVFAISKIKGLDFQLMPKKSGIGIKYAAVFIGVMLVYTAVSYFVGYKLGTLADYDYTLCVRNCLGYLGFQLLLSGPSEEILFRALPLTVLCALGSGRGNKIAAVIISALLFGIAHIGWSFSPFTLSVSWFQVGYAFILGIAYGITYLKSKSIIYPMLMHSMSNVIMVGAGYLLFFFI